MIRELGPSMNVDPKIAIRSGVMNWLYFTLGASATLLSEKNEHIAKSENRFYPPPPLKKFEIST
jgi:hypothetical protein